MLHRFAAVAMGLGLLAPDAFCADEKVPAHPPAAKAARPQSKPPAAKTAPKAQNAPAQPEAQTQGQRLINRLLKMSPEERENALKNLPEPQRQKIRDGLNLVGKMPTVEQNRNLLRAARLQSLPLQRQNQIRRSVRQLQLLPEDRQEMIKGEIRRMAPLPDDERRAYMNTEEFRNRYSPNEQQIMSNLAEIEP